MRGFHGNLTGGSPSSQSTHRTKQNIIIIQLIINFRAVHFHTGCCMVLQNVTLHVADV